jgi:lysophospholipase L1-like esterase
MIALALAAVAAVAPAHPCKAALCGAPSLDAYFAALAAARRPGGAPVHILQIGDSHSASDAITGARRSLLQARFGAGGRGVLPPGRPFAGYMPREVEVEQSDGWTLRSLLHAPDDTRPAFGLSGFRLTATQAGARIALTAAPEAAFDRAVVCAEHGPGAGLLRLTMGQAVTRVDLEAPARLIQCTTLRSNGPQVALEAVAERGPATLLSWATFRSTGGVVLSNLGVIGARLSHFAEMDDQALAGELDAYQPDLIVLAYGTNDGFAGTIDADAYETLLRGQVARLRRIADGVPILLLGAPEGEVKHVETVIPHRRRSRRPAKPVTVVTWTTPPGLAQVRAVQKRVAAEDGLAFWDWAARMGGAGSVHRWAEADPHLMFPDHVHFTAAGGARIAARLEADLAAAAQARRQP